MNMGGLSRAKGRRERALVGDPTEVSRLNARRRSVLEFGEQLLHHCHMATANRWAIAGALKLQLILAGTQPFQFFDEVDGH